jgi:hypothetical protein
MFGGSEKMSWTLAFLVEKHAEAVKEALKDETLSPEARELLKKALEGKNGTDI